MRSFLIFTSLVVIASNVAAQAPMPLSINRSATASLKNGSGADAGTVNILETSKGLLLHVEASGLTPGWHGIHIHEKGDCSDAAFKMAGGHVHSMTPVKHGLLNADANDQGDLPNIYAGADGTAKADLFTSLASLSGLVGAKLLDTDGSAIVIHAKPDDYLTQPIGGAGDRVVCGVIK